jgi:hypothetical protein
MKKEDSDQPCAYLARLGGFGHCRDRVNNFKPFPDHNPSGHDMEGSRRQRGAVMSPRPQWDLLDNAPEAWRVAPALLYAYHHE